MVDFDAAGAKRHEVFVRGINGRVGIGAGINPGTLQ
jgi:hypothetical protein